jgi:hypothetical protein
MIIQSDCSVQAETVGIRPLAATAHTASVRQYRELEMTARKIPSNQATWLKSNAIKKDRESSAMAGRAQD